MVNYIDSFFSRLLAEASEKYPEEMVAIGEIDRKYRGIARTTRKQERELQSLEKRALQVVEKARRATKKRRKTGEVPAESAHRRFRVWSPDCRTTGTVTANTARAAVEVFAKRHTGDNDLKVFCLDGQHVVSRANLAPPYEPWKVEEVSSKNLFLWKLHYEDHFLFVHAKVDFDFKWFYKKRPATAWVVEYEPGGGYRRVVLLRNYERFREWDDSALDAYTLCSLEPERITGERIA